MAETPAIEVADLTVRFRDRQRIVPVVNGVSFSLGRGEVLGILGESGSGKTVSLRALIRLVPANSEIGGRIAIDGEDIASAPLSRLEQLRGPKIAMIFQEPVTALDPVFTIGEQITETIVRREGTTRREAQLRAVDLLSNRCAFPLPGAAGLLPARDVGGDAAARDDRPRAVVPTKRATRR